MVFFSVLAVKLVFRLGLFTLRLLAYAVIGLGKRPVAKPM